MALRDLEIRALVGRDRIYKKVDDRSLYLEVHPNGSKLWRFKYRLAGKDKRIAIGRYPDVGLADARRARDDARRQIQDGLDPVSERKRDKLVAAYRGANNLAKRRAAITLSPISSSDRREPDHLHPGKTREPWAKPIIRAATSS